MWVHTPGHRGPPGGGVDGACHARGRRAIDREVPNTKYRPNGLRYYNIDNYMEQIIKLIITPIIGIYLKKRIAINPTNIQRFS